MTKTPDSELDRRSVRFRAAMEQKGVELALLMDKVDRFYFSGTFQDGVLLVAVRGERALFVRRTLSRAREESPIGEIEPLGGMEDVKKWVFDRRLPCDVIGLEMDVVPARFYLSLSALFPGSRFVDIGMEARKVRSVKSPWEASRMREAGARLDRAFRRVRDEIRPGRSERDVAMRFGGFLMEEGSPLHIRTRTFNMEAMPPYVLSGPSAAMASAMDSPSGGGEGMSVAHPFGPGARKLARGEPLVIDTSFTWEGYVSDCTRVYSIGPPADGFRRAHDVSAECHRLFVETASEGFFIPDLARRIDRLVEDRGLKDVFMGGVKFIGHGVGLELDELPLIAERYEERLGEGMVVAFEPKFVFPEGAVGYENTYCLQGGRFVSFNNTDPEIQIV